jgi:hypothetical protein
MALLTGKLTIEVEYEDLPVHLLGCTRAMLYRSSVEQLYYRRPWASEEDINRQHSKFMVKLDWGHEKKTEQEKTKIEG